MEEVQDGGASDRMILASFDIGVKNLACAVLRLPAAPTPSGAAGAVTEADVLFWRVVPLAAEKERIPTLNELAGRLFAALDELVSAWEADHGIESIDMVLLENQPSRLNGSMKSIQMMIYSYFQLRRHWEGRASAVQMVSASHKTQGHDCEIPTPESKGYKAKKGYALNKWNSVQIADHYCSEDPALAGYFRSHKKKDDLADSLCQALAWARKRGHPIQRVKNYIKEL